MAPRWSPRHGEAAGSREAVMRRWTIGASNENQAYERSRVGRVRMARARRPRQWMRSAALTLAIALPAGGIVAVGSTQVASSQVAASAATTYGGQGELPFLGLEGLLGTAVDSAGDVFASTDQNSQVLEVTPGGTQQA